MFGMNLIAGLLLLPLLGGAVPATSGPGGTLPPDAAASVGGGRLLLSALIAMLSYVIGGYIIGARSPGRTILEPAIAAAIAVAIGLLLGSALSFGNLLTGGLLPFLAALAGGWLGERRQSGGPGMPVR